MTENQNAIDRTAGDVLVFVYRNYKGEVAERRVAAEGVSFYVGTTGWHPERQMLMAGWDLDKRAQRDFAVKDILHFGRMSEAHDISAAPSIRSFQERVQPWMLACFGEEISGDRLERGDRLLEEVLELLQSGDYPPERVAALRDYVWSRKKGEPSQEAGGVITTLAAYCLAHDIDMHGAAETELARIWTKVDVIRAKQAAKPVGSALPIAVSLPAEPVPSWLTNCCECGRVVDKREHDEGGDRHGVELTDERWACSINCAEAEQRRDTASNFPSEIWLEHTEDASPSTGRMWAEQDVFQGRYPAARYVLASVAQIAETAPLSHNEKIDQALRCACHGADDYCPCQNAPDRATLDARAARGEQQ